MIPSFPPGVVASAVALALGVALLFSFPLGAMVGAILTSISGYVVAHTDIAALLLIVTVATVTGVCGWGRR